jgi:hypothetical protein
VALAEPFESAWLKWGMAGMNAFVLRDNITEFASRPNLAMEVQLAQYYDARRHRIVLLLDDVADPFPVLWGLLLGDVVHNYRSSLDHLAWELYKRGRTPNLSEAQERRIYFRFTATGRGSTSRSDASFRECAARTLRSYGAISHTHAAKRTSRAMSSPFWSLFRMPTSTVPFSR